jgi:hypothetical protein
VGGRIAGLPGAAVGAALGAKSTGASNSEAGWGAFGAVVGRVFIPGSQGTTIGAAFMRSLLGTSVKNTGNDITTKKLKSPTQDDESAHGGGA